MAIAETAVSVQSLECYVLSSVLFVLVFAVCIHV